MFSFFTKYNWTGVSLLSVKRTLTTCEERHYATKPDTFYQFGLKHTGKTDITYNGQYIPYHDNTVVYLPLETCGTIDYLRHIREGGTGACIFFDSLYPLPEKPFYLSCAAQPKIPEIFYKMVTVHENKNGGFAAMELFYRLLALLKDTMEKEPDSSSHQAKHTREKLSPALLYIEEHSTAPYIDLHLLSALCGMSPDYFRHCFRSTFGVSPLQYINRRKIEIAKEILQQGYSVAEAAELCGFNGADYFTRCFRTHTGLTPTAFRSSLG